MRILVVGGTGHIGSYLVPRLVLSGHEVKVVARNPRNPTRRPTAPARMIAPPMIMTATANQAATGETASLPSRSSIQMVAAANTVAERERR